MRTGKNVLIVDDDDEISRLLNKTVVDSLTEFPIKSHEASSCFKALELIDDQYLKFKTLPGFILLDINMPFMNGFAFMDKLQSLDFLKPISIIIISTSSDGGDKAKCKELGVKNFFTKPVNSALLKDAILKIIEQIDDEKEALTS